MAADVIRADKKLKYQVKRDTAGAVQWKNASNIGTNGILTAAGAGATATSDATGGFNYAKIPKLFVSATGPYSGSVRGRLKFAGVTFTCFTGGSWLPISKTCNPPTATKTTALVKFNTMNVSIISGYGTGLKAKNKTAAQINQKVTVMAD